MYPQFSSLFLKICFTLSRSVHIWCVEKQITVPAGFYSTFQMAILPSARAAPPEHVAIFRRAQSLNAVVVWPSAPSPPCTDPCPARRSSRGLSPGSPPRSETSRGLNCIVYLLHSDGWTWAVSHLVLDFDHADDAGAVFELDPDEGFVQVSVVPHTQLTCVCETRPQLLRLAIRFPTQPIHRDSNT